MIGVLMRAFALISVFLAVPASAEAIFGMARLADGDTIDIDGTKIRLLDIDAPESDQTCTDDRGRVYLCGKQATEELRRLIRGQNVVCEGRQRDRYRRLLAVCKAGEINLNAQMVRRGWAVRYDSEGSAYLFEELDAAKSGIGLWRGRFERPKDHRRKRWAEAVAAEDTPADCPIKGNISDRGRIYHTPWSRWYTKTRIDIAKGERWFCDEAEAIRAGWRAPLR